MALQKQAILEAMTTTGLVPVFNHADVQVAIKTLDAAYQGGVRVFEFTNRGANALEVFGELALHAQQYPDLYLGIGTIFSQAQAKSFIDQGAQFVVSPAFIPEVAHSCNTNAQLWIPGCGTVTEIYNALALGAVIIKAFPGNVLGPGFIKAVKAVYPSVPMMPTGGVAPTKANLTEWFNAGVSCVGMGSQLFKKDIIANGDFKQITTTLIEALQIIKTIRS
ncbi:MAG: bifunctional 4-hydroxy-2-oxoglutarate aldolase/2-dehydro-3-deoxy-phosphogluconate aldolase [Bacteroidota bacterium]